MQQGMPRDLQNGNGGGGGGGAHHQLQQISHFDQSAAAAAAPDDFFEQVLSTLPAWSDLSNLGKSRNGAGGPLPSPATGEGLGYAAYDESSLLASRLRQQQISGASPPPPSAAKPMGLPQLLNHSPSQPVRLGCDSGLIQLPLTLGGGGGADSDSGVEGLFGFGGSLQRAPQQFHQSQSYGPPSAAGMGQVNAATNGAVAASPVGGGGPPGVQPRQRVRARRGQATDPHSIAERLRRERIAERMKALQELVPNANKTDKASMLDEIIDYVKFLQLQVKVLSMSRLGGAAAVAPLVADMGTRGGNQTVGGGENLTVTEQQVAKMMEEDMGSAMQYLQGKGLCLMPISLASAISTATACHPRAAAAVAAGEGPTSPSMSVLTAQSAAMGGGGGGGEAAKDGNSVSKP